MQMAHYAATRSTCISRQVGAVIVKDKQIIATGYNGPASGLPHCSEQGFCYDGVPECGPSPLPSRAVHAEANAIAQAARYGIATDGATLYVTLEPCLTCLKLVVSAGIRRVYYAEGFDKSTKQLPRDEMISRGLVEVIQLSPQ